MSMNFCEMSVATMEMIFLSHRHVALRPRTQKIPLHQFKILCIHKTYSMLETFKYTHTTFHLLNFRTDELIVRFYSERIVAVTAHRTRWEVSFNLQFGVIWLHSMHPQNSVRCWAILVIKAKRKNSL